LGQKVDATLVTRLLDAGGIIKGKAACENNCFGAVRFVVTAITNVHAKP
jgi:Asp-tRNA(Asn)/Glu-tRNA(Gln) amidotransferase A subunit family amidase